MMGRVAKAAGLLVAVCLGFASASNAAIVSYNLLNQPTQILGLTVGANTYNVSIEYDISFDAVYGTGLPPNIMVPTFLGDPSGALAAITEIAAVLNSEGIFPTIFIVVSVPYDATATGYTFSHASAGATYFVGGGGEPAPDLSPHLRSGSPPSRSPNPFRYYQLKACCSTAVF